MAHASVEQLWSEELHYVVVRRARRRLDVKFFWQSMQRVPAAEAAAGEFDEVEADMQRMSAHINDVTDSGKGEVAGLLRPCYLEYLQRHGVTPD